MRIGQRLTIGFIGIALLVGVVGYLGLNSIKRINESAHNMDIAHYAYEKIAKLEAMVLDQVHEGMHLLSFEEEACIEAFKEIGEGFRKQLEETKLVAAPELQEKFQTLKASHEKFEKMFDEVVKAHYAGQLATKQQRHDIHGVWCPISDEAIELSRELQLPYIEIVKQECKKSEQIIASATRNTIFVSIITLLSAIILGYVISRTISTPITKLRDTANEIGKGDLSKRVEIKSHDEVGDLATSFNQMTDEIHKRNEELQTINEEIRSINEELETSNEELREKTQNLERFHKIVVGRELEMVKLKGEINSLLKKSGQPKKYKVS